MGHSQNFTDTVWIVGPLGVNEKQSVFESRTDFFAISYVGVRTIRNFTINIFLKDTYFLTFPADF